MESQKAETSHEKPKRIGLIIVLLTFGIGGLWAVTAPLQSAALAPGTVVVKGSRKTIQHLEGGIVKELPVSDGDMVEQGDLLVRLDDTQIRAQLEITMGQYYAVKAREARLLAERDGSASVSYPKVITQGNDPRAQDAIQSQNQVFTAQRNALLGEISVLNQRIEQLHSQAKGLGGLKIGKEKLVASYAEEVEDFSQLLEEGFADKNRLRELERSLARTEGEVAELIANIASVEMQVGETRLQILQLQKEFHTTVVDHLSTAQEEMYDLEERIRAAGDKVERADILAPADGIVLGLAVHTIGGVVRPGEPILSVVPQTTELLIEAQVSPVDIDRVHKGQAAKIRFSAFNSQTTPVIEGRLIDLSADAISSDEQSPPFYKAKVEVTAEGMSMLEGLTLVPGMPAEVLINTGSRTMFQYLTQPIRNAFARSLIED